MSAASRIARTWPIALEEAKALVREVRSHRDATRVMSEAARRGLPWRETLHALRREGVMLGFDAVVRDVPCFRFRLGARRPSADGVERVIAYVDPDDVGTRNLISANVRTAPETVLIVLPWGLCAEHEDCRANEELARKCFESSGEPPKPEA